MPCHDLTYITHSAQVKQLQQMFIIQTNGFYAAGNPCMDPTQKTSLRRIGGGTGGTAMRDFNIDPMGVAWKE